jgi:hypothetical protein
VNVNAIAGRAPGQSFERRPTPFTKRRGASRIRRNIGRDDVSPLARNSAVQLAPMTPVPMIAYGE